MLQPQVFEGYFTPKSSFRQVDREFEDLLLAVPSRIGAFDSNRPMEIVRFDELLVFPLNVAREIGRCEAELSKH